MDTPNQPILVPIMGVIPHKAIAYAELLSEAYNKPIALLCHNETLNEELKSFGHSVIHSDLSLKESITHFTAALDVVMIVWESHRRHSHISKALSACRDLRIPYFFVPSHVDVCPPLKVTIPMGFLIEEREKAVWARSLNHHFGSVFSILKPKDKGTRAAKNVTHVEAFFEKHTIKWVTLLGKKSSFKIEKEALSFLRDWADLTMITASREYGLDDQFFGPKELWLIKRSSQVLMVLNPRDDLYILCGD